MSSIKLQLEISQQRFHTAYEIQVSSSFCKKYKISEYLKGPEKPMLKTLIEFLQKSEIYSTDLTPIHFAGRTVKVFSAMDREVLPYLQNIFNITGDKIVNI